jgi:ectoine hydroxylase-related dioxygenase (phytanoyl-CoA dioxygenase family)
VDILFIVLDEIAAALARHGYAVVGGVLESLTVDELCAAMAECIDMRKSRRGGANYGIRDIMNLVPAVRAVAEASAVRRLAEAVLGADARPVRGIYFDKHAGANWKVPWHQDLTIAVREKCEAPGFGPWSVKAGIQHVQPPTSILENLVTIRLHLDDATTSNGPLQVIPGSHLHGRLDEKTIRIIKAGSKPVVCTVPAGGAMLMRPLLLHASSAGTAPSRRRVLHLEYAAAQLPGGLEWYGS